MSEEELLELYQAEEEYLEEKFHIPPPRTPPVETDPNNPVPVQATDLKLYDRIWRYNGTKITEFVVYEVELNAENFHKVTTKVMLFDMEVANKEMSSGSTFGFYSFYDGIEKITNDSQHKYYWTKEEAIEAAQTRIAEMALERIKGE